MNINEIIKYPILTEKTYAQMPNNVYTFAVNLKANQIEIKKAVEFIFQVKVAKINIIKMDKKPKKLGKYKGFTNRIKKAIIFLKEGKINLYPDENVNESKNQSKKVEKANQTIEKVVNKNQEKIALDVEKRVAEKIAAKTKVNKIVNAQEGTVKKVNKKTKITKEINKKQEKTALNVEKKVAKKVTAKTKVNKEKIINSDNKKTKKTNGNKK